MLTVINTNTIDQYQHFGPSKLRDSSSLPLPNILASLCTFPNAKRGQYIGLSLPLIYAWGKMLARILGTYQVCIDMKSPKRISFFLFAYIDLELNRGEKLVKVNLRSMGFKRASLGP